MPTQTNTYGQDITKAGGSIVPTAPSSSAPYSTASTSPLTSTSPSIDVSSLTNPTSPFSLPSSPPDPSATLSGTLNSIPSIASIVGQENTQTPAEQTNKVLNDQLLTLSQQDAGKTQAQTTANNAAGLPGLTAQLTDLNSQITALQKQANAIPLQVQQNFAGEGATSGAVNSIQTGLLRQNTIKALGLSSLASALQGNISTAQAQADAAVKAQFDPIEAEITYINDAIAANKDQMTKEEQEQADTVKAQLDDRTTQIGYQREDMQTAQAWAAAAVKNNPGDQGAQLAAQKALGIDYTQPGALQQAMQLLAPYQSDPTATAQAVANLQSTRADIAYKDAQIKALNDAGDGGTLAQNNLKTTASGTQYVDGSSLTGKNEQAAQQAAAQAGIPYVSAANSGVLTNIDIARSNIAGMQAALTNLSPSNALSRIFEIPNYAAEGLTQSGPEANDLGTYDGWKSGMITAFKGMSGVGTGARGATLVQQLMDDIPAPTDTKAIAAGKIADMNTKLDNSEQGILGTTPSASSGSSPAKGTDGATYGYPGYVSDGTQWVLKQ
jgi:hypothetical protein